MPVAVDLANNLVSGGEYSLGAFRVFDGFRPLVHNADLTMDDSAQGVALDTAVDLGQGRLMIANLGTTGQAIRFAFGTSEAAAEAELTVVAGGATTGLYIPALVDTASGQLLLGVPDGMTHFAVCNVTSGHTPKVSVTQGI